MSALHRHANRLCRFARHLCSTPLPGSSNFGSPLTSWRIFLAVTVITGVTLAGRKASGKQPSPAQCQERSCTSGVCVVRYRSFYELASESCVAGGVQYFRRGWIWLCRLAGTDSLPQVPASSSLSKCVKWKMHHVPEAVDYCCRSLNVNHVTDAQIERRFKEVSPAVLAQAYNQGSRM